MVTLSVLLWLVFLFDAFARVDADAWVFRPGKARPVQRGGDVTLASVGDLVWVPLVPWGRIAVVEEPARQRGERPLECLEDSRLYALRWSSGALALLLLVVLPGLAVRSAFAPWALAWSVAASVALSCTVGIYAVLRRRWQVARAPAPWTLVLSPVSAIHAPHTLTRYAFASEDPLDVASHVLGGEALRNAARQLWWDLPHRRPSVEAMLAERGMAEVLHVPPVPETDDVCRYCPRCLAQYIDGPLECIDCVGTELLPFTEVEDIRE